MTYKPVGIDEDGHFPPRAEEAIGETVAAAIAAIIDPITTDSKTAAGTLASVKNGSAQSTTVQTTTVPIGFMILTIDPTDRDLEIMWGHRLTIVTAGAGFFTSVIWEETIVGSTITLTELDRISLRIEATSVAAVRLDPAPKTIPIGPTTVNRTFAMGAFVTRDAGSALACNVPNGLLTPSWMKGKAT